MEPKINMIGIITSNFDAQKKFYQAVMGFKPILELENFVEFESAGVRFAISIGTVMEQATGEKSYTAPKTGHSFELAFKADSPAQVDSDYKELIEKGAKPIKPPADMPWGQRTAFFADPDGNIHEIFADIAWFNISNNDIILLIIHR